MKPEDVILTLKSLISIYEEDTNSAEALTIAIKELESKRKDDRTICRCKKPILITTVHPLPNICDYCRKEII